MRFADGVIPADCPGDRSPLSPWPYPPAGNLYSWSDLTIRKRKVSRPQGFSIRGRGSMKN